MQKLPVNNFEWIKVTFQFDKDFIKKLQEESDEGYFVEADVQYLDKLHELCNDSPFLPERIKIEKAEKVVANLHDKNKYELVLKKNHKVIKFNQNAWLKQYIDMNTYLRKKSKKWFWIRFFLVDE